MCFNIVKTDCRSYSRRAIVAADAWQGETSANFSVSEFDDFSDSHKMIMLDYSFQSYMQRNISKAYYN